MLKPPMLCCKHARYMPPLTRRFSRQLPFMAGLSLKCLPSHVDASDEPGVQRFCRCTVAGGKDAFVDEAVRLIGNTLENMSVSVS